MTEKEAYSSGAEIEELRGYNMSSKGKMYRTDYKQEQFLSID